MSSFLSSYGDSLGWSKSTFRPTMPYGDSEDGLPSLASPACLFRLARYSCCFRSCSVLYWMASAVNIFSSRSLPARVVCLEVGGDELDRSRCPLSLA